MFPIVAIGALVAAGAAAVAASSQSSGPPAREAGASRSQAPAGSSYLVTPIPSGNGAQAELAAVEAVRKLTV